MSVEIQINTRKLDEITQRLGYNADQVIQWLARQVQAEAAAHAPVDTGALRNSIRSDQVEEAVWSVHDGVEYGIYQELGTSKMSAQPFLIPACEKIAGDINSGSTWQRLFA